MAVAVGLTLLISMMVFVPYPLKMDSEGKLVPVVRRYVYYENGIQGQITKFDVQSRRPRAGKSHACFTCTTWNWRSICTICINAPRRRHLESDGSRSAGDQQSERSRRRSRRKMRRSISASWRSACKGRSTISAR